MYSNRITFRNRAPFTLALATALLCLPAGAIKQTPPQDPCDINGVDGVNAVDVQLCINAVLSIDISPLDGDVDGNGDVSAVDVQLVINGALGLPISLVVVRPGGAQIEVGQQLTLTGLSTDPTDTFTWESSNAAIVSVDVDGVVLGESPGSASVTATGTSSGESDDMSVTVTAPRTLSFEAAVLFDMGVVRIDEFRMADFDGDTHPDVVVEADNDNDDIFLFLCDGAGGFAATSTEANSASFTRLDVVHANGDALPDLLLSEYWLSKYQKMDTYLNDGDGTFTFVAGIDLSAEQTASRFAPGYFNGDGIVDVPFITAMNFSESDGTLCTGISGGTFNAPAVAFSGTFAMLGTGAFLNAEATGDTSRDLVALIASETDSIGDPSDGYDARVLVIPGNGDGTFGDTVEQTIVLDVYYYNDVQAADLDNDGADDLLFAENGGERDVIVLMNSGAGSFSEGARIAPSFNVASQFTTADMDGDTYLDLVVASSAGDAFSVFFGQGDGQFGAEKHFQLPGPQPPTWDELSVSRPRAGDVNDDDVTDLVFYDYDGADNANIAVFVQE